MAIMCRVKINQSTAQRAAIVDNNLPLPILFLRLCVVAFLVAIPSLIILVYALMLDQNVQEMPPLDGALANGSHDANLAYDLWDSEHKQAGLHETLLAYATIDPKEKPERQTIRVILESSGLVDMRKTWWHERPRHAVAMPNWIMQLHSPKYDIHWPRFRQLLGAWSWKKRRGALVMKEFLQNIKSSLDRYFYDMQGPNGAEDREARERYQTCAVVGNSGILLSPKKFGADIDDHELVIRLNNAGVRGFEAFVGSKTSVSFVNSNVYRTGCSLKQNCVCQPYGSVPVVLYLCQVHHLMDIAFCEDHYDSPVIVTDPRFDNLCTRLTKWYSLKNYVQVTGNPIRSWAKNHSQIDFHYSSGLQAVVLALGMCEKVDIFGFGKGPNRRHHYRDSQKAELGIHDYEAEYLFYDDLALNRTLSIPFLNETGIRVPLVTVHT